MFTSLTIRAQETELLADAGVCILALTMWSLEPRGTCLFWHVHRLLARTRICIRCQHEVVRVVHHVCLGFMAAN